ncbi:MAG TPA: enoyl-CoA hydratase/isomerase family protein [Acidobacteriota bacterium]|nr:enoyl-CoA hydratase/isomerase family protein [Acidobacteriota bacterium]
MNGAIVETFRNGIATLGINRPKNLNSYDLEILVRFHQTIEQYSQREDIRVLVFEGVGSTFCTGPDLAKLVDVMESGDVRSLRRLLEVTKQILLLIRRLPQFTLASIDGVAADGGLNLALACDRRIATPASLFGYPFSQVGVSPDVGTSMLLQGLVGQAKALQITLSGKLLSSHEACSLGILDEIVQFEELEGKKADLAQEMETIPPMVLRNVKRAVYRASRQLEGIVDTELEGRIRCFLSDDLKEGLRAFVENRPALFRGS